VDWDRVRADFPILSTTAHGKPLVYLDSAASAQKPRVVIDAVTRFYETSNANIHRGVYDLSLRATKSYEGARKTAARFLGAAEPAEIIFVRGCTEGVNLVAQSFLRPRLERDDEIVITEMEHHSNIVPWQIVCQQTGAKLRVIPMTDRGELNLDHLDQLLGSRVKMLALSHVSNSLGTINPVRPIIEAARAKGIPVLLDGAQAAAHIPIDVSALDVDFYTVSGHKVYGPTGIGVLYGKMTHLESMQPYQGGGDMILTVSFEKTTYNAVPYKFEAGTPNIAGAIGLGAAFEYLEALGMDRIHERNDELLAYANARLAQVDGVRIIGTARHKVPVISFVLENVHPHDMGTVLDQDGIAVRTGHHCAQPVMDHFGIPATTRVSLTFYNQESDVDALVLGLNNVNELFR
jgi:cysteine desulfurase/selenocysteine lyase